MDGTTLNVCTHNQLGSCIYYTLFSSFSFSLRLAIMRSCLTQFSFCKFTRSLAQPTGPLQPQLPKKKGYRTKSHFTEVPLESSQHNLKLLQLIIHNSQLTYFAGSYLFSQSQFPLYSTMCTYFSGFCSEQTDLRRVTSLVTNGLY